MMNTAAKTTSLTAASASCGIALQRPRPSQYAPAPLHIAKKLSNTRGDAIVVNGVKLNADADDLFSLLGDPAPAPKAAPPPPPAPAATTPAPITSSPSPFSIPKAPSPPASAPAPAPTPAPPAAAPAPEPVQSSDGFMDMLRQSMNTPVPAKKVPEAASTATDAVKSAVEIAKPAPEAASAAKDAIKPAVGIPKPAPVEVPTLPSPTPVEAPKAVVEATKAATEAPEPGPAVFEAPKPPTSEAPAPAIPDEVLDSANEAKQAAQALASDASDKVGAGLNAVQDSVGSAADAASKAAGEITGQAGEQIGKAADAVKGGIDSITGGATGAVNQLSADANSALESVNAQIAQAQSAALESAAAAANSALEALPEPVADALRIAGPAVKQAGAFLSETGPTTSAVATALTIGVPAAAVYNTVYGGFAGFLSAQDALAVMQSEEALLVDIRTIAEREANGIPQLKSNARRKALAVPFATVNTTLKGRIEGAGALAEDITAVQIAGLTAINAKTTKVIIMDRNGFGAKSMARKLRKLGVSQPYVLDGGFQSFKKASLVQEGNSMYDPSQLKVIADDVSAASETLVEQLKNPASAVGIAAGGLGFGLAVWQYHYTLQFIGVLGILLTVLRKAASYDSPTEFFEEVGELVERAQMLAAPLAATSKKAVGAGSSAGDSKKDA